MIYTSYFANIKNLPGNVFPVAITAIVPDWYHGKTYSVLAPSKDTLMKIKRDNDVDTYTQRYTNEILNRVFPSIVAQDLTMMLPLSIQMRVENVCINPDYHIALICYEKPDAFCHRHLLAEWLTQNGIPCSEWRK